MIWDRSKWVWDRSKRVWAINLNESEINLKETKIYLNEPEIDLNETAKRDWDSEIRSKRVWDRSKRVWDRSKRVWTLSQMQSELRSILGSILEQSKLDRSQHQVAPCCKWSISRRLIRVFSRAILVYWNLYSEKYSQSLLKIESSIISHLCRLEMLYTLLNFLDSTV